MTRLMAGEMAFVMTVRISKRPHVNGEKPRMGLLELLRKSMASRIGENALRPSSLSDLKGIGCKMT